MNNQPENFCRLRLFPAFLNSVSYFNKSKLCIIYGLKAKFQVRFTMVPLTVWLINYEICMNFFEFWILFIFNWGFLAKLIWAFLLQEKIQKFSEINIYIFNKRQNGWTDQAQFFCGTSRDPRKDLWMIKISKNCAKKFFIFVKFYKSWKSF